VLQDFLDLLCFTAGSVILDLDGSGHGGASMHAPDENLQVSFWLTPTTARKLADDLQELADGVTSSPS
jgi:hypothetical protein